MRRIIFLVSAHLLGSPAWANPSVTFMMMAQPRSVDVAKLKVHALISRPHCTGGQVYVYADKGLTFNAPDSGTVECAPRGFYVEVDQTKCLELMYEIVDRSPRERTLEVELTLDGRGRYTKRGCDGFSPGTAHAIEILGPPKLR